MKVMRLDDADAFDNAAKEALVLATQLDCCLSLEVSQIRRTYLTQWQRNRVMHQWCRRQACSAQRCYAAV